MNFWIIYYFYYHLKPIFNLLSTAIRIDDVRGDFYISCAWNISAFQFDFFNTQAIKKNPNKPEIKDAMVDNKEWGDKTSENCSKIWDDADENVVPKTEKRIGVINEPALQCQLC